MTIDGSTAWGVTWRIVGKLGTSVAKWLIASVRNCSSESAEL